MSPTLSIVSSCLGFFYSLVTLGCVLEFIRQVFHIIACTVFFFYLQSVFEYKNGTRFSNFLVMLSWFWKSWSLNQSVMSGVFLFVLILFSSVK